MNFLRLIFGRKEQWVEFDTLYSTRRLERLRIFMAENNIPYKVRAALLLVPLNTPMPIGAVTQSLWYIAVRSGDVHRVQHYLRTERDTEDGAVIGTSAVNGWHPAADRRSDFCHSPSMALYRPSLGGCVWMPDGSSELSGFQKRRRLKHTAS